MTRLKVSLLDLLKKLKKEKSALISIRLSDNMIKDLKHIADVLGIGYQTLISQNHYY